MSGLMMISSRMLLIPGARRRDARAVTTWAPGYLGRSVVVVCQQGLQLSQGVSAWMRHQGTEWGGVPSLHFG
jgi:hypothetical protein